MEQWQSGVTMSGFTEEQYTGVMEMLDLDAMPQEVMIFHCEGRLPVDGKSSTFEICRCAGLSGSSANR
jgi:hypothetical protein